MIVGDNQQRKNQVRPKGEGMRAERGGIKYVEAGVKARIVIGIGDCEWSARARVRLSRDGGQRVPMWAGIYMK